MKKITLLSILACLILPALMIPSCASGAPAQEGSTKFSDVQDKEWFLSEIKTGGKTITIDRKKFEAENMAGYFSITFQKDKTTNENRVGGMGAPNRYFGPYTEGSNRSLTIGNLASTLMMAFKEPEGIKEYEYFQYLSKVTRWNLRDGKLELSALSSDGKEAALVFTGK